MESENELKVIITSAEIMERADRKKRNIFLGIVAIIFVLVFVSVFPFMRVMYWSTEKVRRDILEIVPIGTSFREAEGKILWQENWDWDRKYPYYDNGKWVISFSLEDSGHSLVQVYIRFIFDEDYKLEEVIVRQYLLI